MDLVVKMGFWLYRRLFVTLLFLAPFSVKAENIPEDIRKELILEKERLKKEGLDPSPVETKLREGLAKNVAYDKILRVVKQEVNLHLRSARMVQEAGHAKKGELIQAMVIALRRGAREEDLARTLRLSENEQKILEKIDILGKLAQAGKYGLEAQKEIQRLSYDPQEFHQKSLLPRDKVQSQELQKMKPMVEETVNPPKDNGHTGTLPRNEQGHTTIEFHK